MSYYYAYQAYPTKLQTNPFLVLGYLCGVFAGLSAFTGVMFILFKSNELPKIIQKLHELQGPFKFSSKKINVMLGIIILQLVLCYTSCAGIIFTTYDDRITNIFLRILVAFGSFIMITPMFTIEMLFINVVGVMGEYFKMMNENLNELCGSPNLRSVIW